MPGPILLFSANYHSDRLACGSVDTTRFSRWALAGYRWKGMRKTHAIVGLTGAYTQILVEEDGANTDVEFDGESYERHGLGWFGR